VDTTNIMCTCICATHNTRCIDTTMSYKYEHDMGMTIRWYIVTSNHGLKCQYMYPYLSKLYCIWISNIDNIGRL